MKRILTGLVCIVLLGLPAVRDTPRCEVCRLLGEAGFPPSYREGLCALQLAHPTWRFEPLFVSALAEAEGEDYRFSQVVEKESEAERSLVPSGEVYAPYRRADGALTDSGYYPASRETVAYFLDPRNFLTEEGIFQFFVCLPSSDRSEEELACLLEGARWESVLSPEDLREAGAAAGVDPLFLAARLYQEQGAEGTALLYGTAGTCLLAWYESGREWEGDRWIAPPEGQDEAALLSLDGYCNPLHVGAAGEGSFSVYLQGALHARLCGWDTPEKGLLGGAKKLAEEYLSCHQETVYLQKWNVDVRSRTPTGESRNFWGQYMQNVAGAKAEGERLASLLAESSSGMLLFRIPVYEGLPEAPCPDPGRGSALAFAVSEPLTSPHRITEEKVPSVTQAEGEAEKGEKEREERPASASVEEKREGVSDLVLVLLILSFAVVSVLLLFLMQGLLRIFSPILLGKQEKY